MEQIQILYEKYLDRSITDQEKTELFRLIRDAKDDQLGKLGEKYLKDDRLEKLDDLQEHMNVLHGNILKHINSVQSPKLFPFRKYLTVAAALITFAFIAFYLYKSFNPSEPEQRLTSIYGDDVAPGGNRATIALSDGTVIPLDENQSGIVASGTELSYTDGEKLLDASKVQYATLNTPRGGQYKLTLPDGTIVLLNAESSLTYPTTFTDKQRKVELKGEAFFDVKENKAQPFIVQSKDQQVTVTGTSFNMSMYDGEIPATTLVEGRVQIDDLKSGQTSMLVPGQQATSDTRGLVIRNVDIETFTAWKDGYFVFDSMELSQILKQLSRWYDVDVDYTGVPNETLSARVKRDKNISSVLNAISKTTGINFYVKERRIMLKK